MSTIEQYREGFDLEPGYLDWASFGPLSRAVRQEAAADLELLGTGRSSGIDLVGTHLDEARTLVAGLLGTTDESIVFQPSTSDGLMQAVFGVTGGVVVARSEYPSLTLAVARAAESLHVVEPQWVDPPASFMTPEVIERALTPQTRAVALSLVDFRTGYRADLEAIREVIGDRLLIVDATQAFGVIDAPYTAADVVVAHGYKWLRAGRGAAFAAFSPRALDELTAVFSGPAGTDVELPLDEVPPPSEGARRFSVSRPDPLAVARLAAAAHEFASVGAAAVDAAVAERTAELIDLADRFGIPVVTPRDARHRAGIVALRPTEADMTPLTASLANHGITCRIRSGMIRLSAHAGTGPESMTLLADALAVARVVSRTEFTQP